MSPLFHPSFLKILNYINGELGEKTNERKSYQMMHFYEIDTTQGIVCELSKFFCGTAPTGGEVVYASKSSEAQELWFRYRNGEKNLKGTIMINGQDYPYRNIICETAYHTNEKDEDKIA
jgi:hypothetical protein